MPEPAPFPSYYQKPAPPILIIDHHDLIGSKIYEENRQQTLTVLASEKEPELKQNLVFLKYENKLPKVPNSVYSRIIFVLDPEKHVINLLPEFFHKAQKDKAQFALIMKHQNFHAGITRNVLGYKHSYIFVLGDTFGKDVLNKHESFIDTAIFTAKSKGTIKAEGMGMSKLYPVFFEDTLTLISQTLKEKKTGGLFFVFSKTPTNQLTLARFFKKIDPAILLGFTDKKTTKSQDLSTQRGEYLLPETYLYETKLNKLYKSLSVPIDYSSSEKEETPPDMFVVPKFQQKTPMPKPPPSKLTRGIGNLIIISCITLLLSPLIATTGFAMAGNQLLILAKSNIQKGNMQSSLNNTQEASILFSLAQNTANTLLTESALIGQQNNISIVQQKIDSAKTVSQGLSQMLKGTILLKTVFESANPNAQDNIIQSVKNVKEGIINLQIAQATGNMQAQDKNILTSLLPTSDILTALIGNTPQILGLEKNKQYLMLLQNNLNLRPGGGFINTYALASFKNGQFQNIAINNVYAADNQLKGHIEPPFPIRRYLPSMHWYLHDSNFDVDFSEGAKQAATMLFQETGVKVDGVIAIDLSFLKELLKAIGPVTIPSTAQTITADNLLAITQTQTEKASFDANPQTQDFLPNLLVSIEKKMKETKNIPSQEIFTTVLDGLTQKHLLVTAQDTQLQNLLSVNNLASTLWDGRVVGSGILNDVVGINEANLGNNNANYFITRNVNQEMQISGDGTVSGTLSITYKNTSQKNQSADDYKNYLRIILPTGATLKTMTIGGKTQTIVPAITDFTEYEKKNFKSPNGLEVNGYSEEDKAIYGFLTVIPAGETQTMQITYTIPGKIDITQPLTHYRLHLFKQPGTDTYPYALTIILPADLKPMKTTNGTIQNGEVTYINNLTTDQDINIDLAKNQ